MRATKYPIVTAISGFVAAIPARDSLLEFSLFAGCDEQAEAHALPNDELDTDRESLHRICATKSVRHVNNLCEFCHADGICNNTLKIETFYFVYIFDSH